MTSPNIVFILADDLAYRDLSCLGQENFTTPNLDRMASQGCIFTNAYAGAPWCAPSRACLLTGSHGGNCDPVSANADGVATAFKPTIAEVLKPAGYATCALGKWHMTEGTTDSWLHGDATMSLEAMFANTNWHQMPWNRGYDVCRIGYRSGFEGHNGNPYFPQAIETGDREYIPLPENQHLDGAYLWREPRNEAACRTTYNDQCRFADKAGNDSRKLRYSEDIYREEAVSFMRQHRGGPFYLHYASPLVHSPTQVPDYSEFRDRGRPWELVHQIYAAMVRELDRSVGVLLDEVEALGIADNTIIIFASDNGYAGYTVLEHNLDPNRPFRRLNYNDDPVFRNKGEWNRGKFITMNGGVHVPFIAWGPGRVPAGARTDRAVNFYDVMATAADLAGLKAEAIATDGVSFRPVLEGRDAEQPLRNHMVWPACTSRFVGGVPLADYDEHADSPVAFIPNAALLDERWYAIEMGDDVFLFDIVHDPGMELDRSAEDAVLYTRARELFSSLPPARKITAD